MLHVDGVRLDRIREIRALADAVDVGLDPAPIILLDPQLLRRLGIDIHRGEHVDLAHPGRIAILGVEERMAAATRDQRERVLLDQVFAADLRDGRLDVHGKRAVAVQQQVLAPQLHLAVV